MNLVTIFGLASLAIVAISVIVYIALNDKDDEEELIQPAERNKFSNHYSDYNEYSTYLKKKANHNPNIDTYVSFASSRIRSRLGERKACWFRS